VIGGTIDCAMGGEGTAGGGVNHRWYPRGERGNNRWHRRGEHIGGQGGQIGEARGVGWGVGWGRGFTLGWQWEVPLGWGVGGSDHIRDAKGNYI
jgi:hypothetical protein